MPSPDAWYATNARLLQEERRMTRRNGTDSETFAAMTPKQPATAADHRRFIPDDMKPNDAYILGQRDRYRRDREPDIKCRNCGQPWAIEAEASGSAGAESTEGAAAPDVDVLRADIAQAIHDALTSPPAHEPSYPDTVADRIVARLLHKEPTDE